MPNFSASTLMSMRLACPKCKAKKKQDHVDRTTDGYRARVDYVCGSQVLWDVTFISIKKDFLKPCPSG